MSDHSFCDNTESHSLLTEHASTPASPDGVVPWTVSHIALIKNCHWLQLIQLTWGAILMAWQTADLGHDFYQSFYILQNGALQLQSDKRRFIDDSRKKKRASAQKEERVISFRTQNIEGEEMCLLVWRKIKKIKYQAFDNLE